MILQGLKIALESLWANKMRSFLSMLGIVIGVGAVIAIVSVGTGSTQQITARIANLGSNMITIYPRALRGQFGRLSSISSQQKFTLELSEHLEEFCPSVKQVIPLKQVNGRLISDDVNINSAIIGTRAEYTEINNYEIAQGVFINQEDDLERRQVIVLGHQLASDLFDNENPLGNLVRLNYDGRIFQFTVIGVMKEKGGSMAGNLDERAYVPLSVVMDRLTAQKYVDSLLAQAYSSDEANRAVQEIEYFMQKHLEDEKREQFRITSQDEILDTVSSVTNTMNMMLGGIAAIS
ncbi:MAG TPA: ABC transporter permease, partial [Atribacterota bacterium]|nr:ABC transporter permease [Atribacterota bacterium]